MEESVKTFDNPVKISEWFSHYRTGNRIKKTSGSVVTKYIVDPNRTLPSVLAETNSSGTITAYYVYGLGLISKVVGSTVYFYQYDGLGSTVAITDKTGAVVNKYAYDDFGNLATNSTETVANPFKYVGRFGVITDLGDLLHMRARYYMPSIGRFINKDPIGLVGGLNKYTYVKNNPINWVDPAGLKECALRCIRDALGNAALSGDLQLCGVSLSACVGFPHFLNPACYIAAIVCGPIIWDVVSCIW